MLDRSICTHRPQVTMPASLTLPERSRPPPHPNGMGAGRASRAEHVRGGCGVTGEPRREGT